MDRSALIDVIKEWRDATPDGWMNLLFSKTNPKLSGPDAALAWGINEYFKEDEWLQGLRICDDHRVVDLASVAAWTASLVRAEADPAKAVDMLLSFLQTGEASATSYLLLGGLFSVKDTDLAPNMQLSRIKSFQASPYARTLFDLPEVKAFDGLDRPACVLSLKHTVEGLVLSPVQQSERDKDWLLHCSDRGAREEMKLISNCLALIGPHPVIPICDWCEIDPRSAPPGLELDAYVGLERMPYATFMSGEDFDSGACRELVSAFRSLPAARKDALRIPMTRLNRAMRGHQEVDRAIDLGISLEALLVKGNQTGAIGKTIQHKGGEMLADGDESKRADIEQKLKTGWKQRSEAAHKGRLLPGWEEDLTDGILIAAKLIARTITGPEG